MSPQALDEGIRLPEMPEPKRAGFGGYLRDLRREAGFTQRQLAELTDLDFTYLSKLENNRLEHTPSELALLRLAAPLPVDAWELMRRAGKLPTPFRDRLMAMSSERWRELMKPEEERRQ